MRARRAVTVGLVVAGLAAVSGAAWADDRDTPGTNDLELQVRRLERAEQADVVGAESSSMLFAPRDSEAITTAQEARRGARSVVTDSLFVIPVAPYQVSGSTTELFVADAYPGTPAARDAPDLDAEAQSPGGWVLIGLGVLLVVGCGSSFALRTTGDEEPWTATST
ncbi:hypothetical protein [Cellulomonas sp. Marseille-Q8402]